MGRESKQCMSCFSSNRITKIEWPTDEDLIGLLERSNYVRVGLLLDVSDNAIRKGLGRK